MGDKKYWPEHAGTDAKQAKRNIEAEAPGVAAIIVAADPKPKDLCCNRVYVVARNGIAVQVPQIGWREMAMVVKVYFNCFVFSRVREQCKYEMKAIKQGNKTTHVAHLRYESG
ncbi:hypothetical protein ACLOJK_030337 [Asimina triloba]